MLLYLWVQVQKFLVIHVNYIDLNTMGPQNQREYKLKIKVVEGSYSMDSDRDSEVIDNNLIFKIR